MSVAIASRNRALELDGLLASLEAMTKPEGFSFEIVIALNACTDDSRDVVARYSAALPIVIVEEPRIGVSFARNAILERVRGRMIAWLDDDVLVDHGWMTEYQKAIERYPDTAIFGGRIDPLFVGPLPAWLASTWELISDVFAMRRPATDAPISLESLPYGANYGVRADWQQRYLFNVSLGRQGTFFVIGGEETGSIYRMFADGATGRWMPGVRVQHVIRPNRMTRKYIFRYYAGYGYDVGRYEANGPPSKRLSRLQLARCFFDGWIFLASASMFGRPDLRIRALEQAATMTGRVVAKITGAH